MKQFFQFSASLLLLLLTVSCGLFSSRTVVLTEKDSGSVVSVRTGDTIVIRLAANPATGYLWSANTPNDYVLRLLGGKYEQTANKKELCGAPSVKVFTYAVVGPGETGIRMEYRRPWEKDVKPTQTFDVLVRAVGDTSFRDLSETDPKATPRVGSKGQIEPR